MKVCQQCRVEKEFSEFYSDKRNKDGLYVVCKVCHQANNKKYKDINKNRVLETQKKYREENKIELREKGKLYRTEKKDIVRESKKKYREANHEKLLEKNREYRKSNFQKIHEYYLSVKDKFRDKRQASVRNRRARRNYIEGKITAQEWKELKERYGNRCLCCGRNDVKLELDHVVPLAMGGKHSIDNAQPLCRSCNGRKHVKVEDYRNGIYARS